MGIEPTLAAWEAAVLPLNYTRTERSLCGVGARMQCGAREGRRKAKHQAIAWIRSRRPG